MAPALWAESANERDFKQLRANRDKAMATAAEPINRRYKEEVEKLFKRATQAAELDLAKELQAELQVLGGTAAVMAVSGTGTPQTTTSTGDKTDLRKLFEETQWVSVSGEATFIFRRGGKIDGNTGWPQCYTIEGPDTLKLYRGDLKKINKAKAEYILLRVNVSDKTGQQDVKASTHNGNLSIKYDGPAKALKK